MRRRRNRGEWADLQFVIFLQNGSINLRQEKYFPGNILFLLQPNTAEQELREFLWEHFFQIQDECAVQDGSHVYAGIKGHFTKEKELYTKVECYTGKVMCRRLAENDVIYYKALYQKYRNVLAGLTAKREPDEGMACKISNFTGIFWWRSKE